MSLIDNISEQNSAIREKLIDIALHSVEQVFAVFPVMGWFQFLVIMQFSSWTYSFAVAVCIKISPRMLFQLPLRLFSHLSFNGLLLRRTKPVQGCTKTSLRANQQVFKRYGALLPGERTEDRLLQKRMGQNTFTPVQRDRVTDTLEEIDYDFLTMVSQFLNEIVDICGGNSRTACGTAVFTSCHGLVSLLYRRRMRPGWTDEELSLLKENKSRASRIVRGKL